MKPRRHDATTTVRRTAIAAAVGAALALSAPSAAAQAKAERQAATGKASADASAARTGAAPDYTAQDWQALAHSSLELRVQSALAESRSLRGVDIDVESDDRGKVTLSGAVANEGQKARALRIARVTTGVREVEDDIDVDDSLKIQAFEDVDDGELTVTVAKAIAAAFDGATTEDSWFFGHDVKGKHPDGEDWTIEVLSDNGRIELNGEVPTNDDISKALQAARGVAGVRAVENDLRSDENEHLRRAPLAYRYTWPGPMYRATLVTADGMAENTLVCRVDHLRGGTAPVAVRTDRSEIASAEMRELKHEAASGRTADDVRPRSDDQKWASMAREGMALRVESRLAASPSLQASSIEVESDGMGTVTLKGKVNSDRQQERAERIARAASGVETVNNRLQVDESLAPRSYEPVNDGDLARSVAEAIAKKVGGGRVEDSWMFGHKVEARTGDNDWSIEVEADAGEIELNGDVPTYAIERTVLRAARDVAGVSHIENDLDTDEDRLLMTRAPEQYRYSGKGVNRSYRGDIADTQRSARGGNLICQVASAGDRAASQ